MRTATPPVEYEEQRLSSAALADFRCEVCWGRYPFELLVVQDGAKVCKPNCAYDRAPSERVLLAAEAVAEAAQATAGVIAGASELFARASNWSLMDGVAVVTKIQSGTTIYPTPIAMTFGGDSKSVTLTGVVLSSADTIAYSAAGFSNGAVVYASDQTTATFTVTTAVGVARGDYDLLYNGTRFPKVFSVR